MIERARDLQWDRVGSNPQLCHATGHTNFCSFLSLNFLFWQTEITPNWQNLSGFKKRSHLKCPSPVHDTQQAESNKRPVWEGGPCWGRSKALPGGVAPQRPGHQHRWWTEWARACQERPMPLSSPCLKSQWTSNPQGLCPTGKQENQGLLGGQGYQGHAQSPNSASLGRANQTSIHRYRQTKLQLSLVLSQRNTISGRFLRFCHRPGSHLFCQMDPCLLFLSFWSTPLLNSAYRLNPG